MLWFEAGDALTVSGSHTSFSAPLYVPQSLSSRRGIKLTAKLRIVVVEDNISVAGIIAQALRDAGHRVVGQARTVDHSLQLLAKVKCDAAILDADLMGASSSKVASALKDKRIPFVVLSGSERLLSPAHRGAPFIVKPLRLDALVEAVDALQGRPGKSRKAQLK